jgi:RNA polymerase sigma factor (sigma-70 family)
VQTTTANINSSNGNYTVIPVNPVGTDTVLAEMAFGDKDVPKDPLLILRKQFAIEVLYIDHPYYSIPSKHEEILSGPDFGDPGNRSSSGKKRKTSNGDGQGKMLPYGELGVWLPQTQLLTKPQEFGLFLRYNFLKYKQNILQKDFSAHKPDQVPEDALQEFDRLQRLVVADRNHLIEANSRLIVSIAKKFVGPTILLDELLAEGIAPILKAIDCFECGRGFKFSTYATRGLLQHFIRFTARERTRSTRFQPSEFIESNEVSDTAAPTDAAQKADITQSLMKWMVEQHLDPREQDVIIRRFGLDSRSEETLQAVGDALGISKERIRQLERRAINKLRELVTMHHELEDLISDDLSEGYFFNQHMQCERDFTDLCAKIVLSLPRKEGEGMTLSRLVDWADSQPQNERYVDILCKALDHLVTIGALEKMLSPEATLYCLSTSSRERVETLRRGITRPSLQATINYLAEMEQSLDSKFT